MDSPSPNTKPFPTKEEDLLTPLTIIVIDDHEVVRKGLVSIINTQTDMEVVAHCGDPESGTKFVEQHKPDLVLTDISMPGSSPFEMVRKIKDTDPATKVIFLTAYSSDSNLERALRAGAQGFLTKTDPIEEVMTAIRKVRAGEKYFSGEIKDRIVQNGENANGSDSAPQDDVTVRRELLSPREIEVLCCVGRGQTAKQIAQNLKISAKTVERHKSNIMAKLGIHSQVDLARYAIREGLINP